MIQMEYQRKIYRLTHKHKSPSSVCVVGNDMQVSHNYSAKICIYKLISLKGLWQSFDTEFRTFKGGGMRGNPTILTTALVAISMPRVAKHKACWWMTIWMDSSQNTDGVRGCQRMIYVVLVVSHYYYYHYILYTSQIIKSVHYRWLALHMIYITIL